MPLRFERCTPENYKKFLEVSNKAFLKSEADWFSNNMGHIFLHPAEKVREDFVKNNYLAFMDDIPAGTIGIYPINVKMGEMSLLVAGIGTVGVLEEFRGKGIMSFMMKNILDEIESSDYDLAWLAGERLRYKNYGFDLGGKTLKIQLDKKSFRKDYKNFEAKMHQPDLADINALDNSFKKYQNRVLRTRENWERQLSRENLCWNFDGESSYFVYFKDSPQIISECAGDFVELFPMLKTHLETYSLQNIELVFPFENNELILSFFNVSSGYNVTACNQIRVCSRLKDNSDKFLYCSEILSKSQSETNSFFINEIDKV